MVGSSRHPQIDDLLFTTCRESDYNSQCTCYKTEEKHVGIITEIERDKHGHQKHVRLEWFTDRPINYREEDGFAGVNIHNLRHEFEIIRDGIKIR